MLQWLGLGNEVDRKHNTRDPRKLLTGNDLKLNPGAEWETQRHINVRRLTADKPWADYDHEYSSLAHAEQLVHASQMLGREAKLEAQKTSNPFSEDRGKLWNNPTDELKGKINFLRKELGLEPLDVSWAWKDTNRPEYLHFRNKASAEVLMDHLVEWEMEYLPIKVELDFTQGLKSWLEGTAPPEQYERCFWANPTTLKEFKDNDQYKRMIQDIKEGKIYGDVAAMERLHEYQDEMGLLRKRRGVVEAPLMKDRDNFETQKRIFLETLKSTAPKSDAEALLFYKYIVLGHPLKWEDSFYLWNHHGPPSDNDNFQKELVQALQDLRATNNNENVGSHVQPDITKVKTESGNVRPSLENKSEVAAAEPGEGKNDSGSDEVKQQLDTVQQDVKLLYNSINGMLQKLDRQPPPTDAAEIARDVVAQINQRGRGAGGSAATTVSPEEIATALHGRIAPFNFSDEHVNSLAKKIAEHGTFKNLLASQDNRRGGGGGAGSALNFSDTVSTEESGLADLNNKLDEQAEDTAERLEGFQNQLTSLVSGQIQAQKQLKDDTIQAVRKMESGVIASVKANTDAASAALQGLQQFQLTLPGEFQQQLVAAVAHSTSAGNAESRWEEIIQRQLDDFFSEKARPMLEQTTDKLGQVLAVLKPDQMAGATRAMAEIEPLLGRMRTAITNMAEKADAKKQQSMQIEAKGNEETEKLKKQVSSLQNTLKKERHDHLAQGQARIPVATAELEAVVDLEKEKKALQEQLDQTIREKEDTIKQSQGQLQQAEQQLQLSTGNNEQLVGEVARLKSEIENQQSTHQQLTLELQNSRGLQTANQLLEREVLTLQNNLKSSETALVEYKAKANAQIEQAQEAVKQNETQVVLFETKVQQQPASDELKSSLRHMRKELKDSQRDLEVMTRIVREDEAGHTREIRQLTNEINQKDQQLARFDGGLYEQRREIEQLRGIIRQGGQQLALQQRQLEDAGKSEEELEKLKTQIKQFRKHYSSKSAKLKQLENDFKVQSQELVVLKNATKTMYDPPMKALEAPPQKRIQANSTLEPADETAAIEDSEAGEDFEGKRAKDAEEQDEEQSELERTLEMFTQKVIDVILNELVEEFQHRDETVQTIQETLQSDRGLLLDEQGVISDDVRQEFETKMVEFYPQLQEAHKLPPPLELVVQHTKTRLPESEWRKAITAGDQYEYIPQDEAKLALELTQREAFHSAWQPELLENGGVGDAMDLQKQPSASAAEVAETLVAKIRGAQTQGRISARRLIETIAQTLPPDQIEELSQSLNDSTILGMPDGTQDTTIVAEEEVSELGGLADDSNENDILGGTVDEQIEKGEEEAPSGAVGKEEEEEKPTKRTKSGDGGIGRAPLSAEKKDTLNMGGVMEMERQQKKQQKQVSSMLRTGTA